MKLVLALFLLPLLAPAGADPVFPLKPYAQPAGQTLRIETTSASKDARIITEKNGTKQHGILNSPSMAVPVRNNLLKELKQSETGIRSSNY